MAKRYTEEDVERGLSVLAFCAGNTTKAAKVLAEKGHPIPARTLAGWKQTKPDRYAEVRDRAYREVQTKMAAEYEDLAMTSIDLERKVIARMEKDLYLIPARDLPGAQRNIATAAAIHTDKARLLRDQPAVVVEHRNLDELRRKWEAQGLLVNGTAEELPHGRHRPSAAELPAGDGEVPPGELEPAA